LVRWQDTRSSHYLLSKRFSFNFWLIVSSTVSPDSG
jgi:hypothetical protein